MRVGNALIAVVALTMATTQVSAQSAPNFSGTWAVVMDPNAPPAGGRGGFGGLGQGAMIVQDGKVITITRTTQAGEIKTVYNMDGSDSKNTLTMGGNSFDQMSKVKWEGGNMKVTTTSNFNGNTSETTQVWSMDADGNLNIETTAPGRGGGAPTTTKRTYKKG